MNALREHDTLRDQLMPKAKDPSFFVSLTARRLIYAVVCPTFRTLVDAAASASTPRTRRGSTS